MLGDSSYTVLILPFCVALPVWYWLRRRPKNTLPYPPGPKGYPLIGNILFFLTGAPLWKGFRSMANQHSPTPHLYQYFRSLAQHFSITGTDVLYLNAPGMHMVVLSSLEAISDLLDQRSAIYSDRVRSHRSKSSISVIHLSFASRLAP
jgi:hypothetical protein